MKKSDVQFHSDGYGYQRGRPAVNVRVRKDLDDGIREFHKAEPETPARYTERWIRENLSDEELNHWWQAACEHCFEQAEEDAKTIFGSSIKAYSEGRSGGWMVLEGLKEFDSWNGADLAKWAKFERWAKQAASDVPYQCVDLIFYNVFERKELERDEELQREAII